MGEIAYLGPGFVIGYLGQGDPSAAQLRTHRAFPGRTVVYTGDLGYQDEDCYVYLKGRASRVITLDDGTTVWPAEIESSLGARPDVADAFAAGVVVNGKVEVGFAVVADQGVEVEDLRAELSVAAHVTIWPELPTTPNGKPAVARITAMLATEFDTETNATR